MSFIARFATRPSGDNSDQPDLGIIMFSCKNTQIKANRVYEINDVGGVLTLKDLGECILGMSVPDSVPGIMVCWSSTIGSIIASTGKLLGLTRKEYYALGESSDET